MKSVGVILISMLLAGCATFNRMEIDSNAQKAFAMLSVGDQVRIETYSAQQFSFQITAIDESCLYGEEYQIDINDIAIIERKEPTVVGSVMVLGTVALSSYALYVLVPELLIRTALLAGL